jgi:hypothetical protein
MTDFLEMLRRLSGLTAAMSPMPPQMTPAPKGAIPAQSPFGNMRFGGNTFGGNRFGGNRFGASAPQSVTVPATPPVPQSITVPAAPPAAAGREIMERSGDPRFDALAAAVPGAPVQGPVPDFGAPAPQAPQVPPMPAPRHIAGGSSPFMEAKLQSEEDAAATALPPETPPAAPSGPSATPAGRSLLDRIMGSSDPSTRDRFGLTQADRHANAFDALSRLGFTLMAAGMPQSPNQSAQILGSLAGPNGVVSSLMRGRSMVQDQNAEAQKAEQREMALSGQRAARDIMQSPEFQEAYRNMPASMQALARAAAATGDTKTILGMMIPRAVRGGYVDPATGHFIPTGGDGANGPGGKVTEFQAKNAQYWTALSNSNDTLNKYESEGSNLYNQLVDRYVPNVVNNYFKSDKASQYFNAQKVWAEQVLRLATGAAAPQHEQEQYRTLWFPQPGESADAIAAKRRLREQITAQIRQNAGNALGKSAAEVFDASGAIQSGLGGGAAPAMDPAARRAALEAEARRRGLIK